MATDRHWRFSFLTRTVMGFVSSSLNLATGTGRADDTAVPDQPPEPPLPDRNPVPFEPQVVQTRPVGPLSEQLPERRRYDRNADGLNIAGPSTWRRRHSSASHVTEFCTPNPRAGVASIAVPPAVDFGGTAEGFESGMLRTISKGMPIVEGSTKTGTVGRLRFVSCSMKPPWGAPRHIVLYTALWDGKGQAILFGADCDQLFHDNVLIAHALVQKIAPPDRSSNEIH